MGREICYSNSQGDYTMIFSETNLAGAYIIEIEKNEDERGFFARTLDMKQYEQMRIDSKILQSSISFNKKRGTLRGMHYQVEPFEESKFVRCTKGKIFDVILDLRKNSKTFKKWISVELSDINHKMMYVPKGFAHGFQTLEDNSEVYYEITQIFSQEYAKGIRYNDPFFKIKWPLENKIMSEKDSKYLDYIENKEK